jgi:hypothetical protein
MISGDHAALGKRVSRLGDRHRHAIQDLVSAFRAHASAMKVARASLPLAAI